MLILFCLFDKIKINDIIHNLKERGKPLWKKHILLAGRIFICSQIRDIPVGTTYDQNYIFYKKNNQAKNILKNNKNIYEIFTDDEFEIYTKDKDSHDHKFGKKYVVDIHSINSYLTHEELKQGIVTKWRLIEIYNKINQKQNVIQKEYARYIP